MLIFKVTFFKWRIFEKENRERKNRKFSLEKKYKRKLFVNDKESKENLLSENWENCQKESEKVERKEEEEEKKFQLKANKDWILDTQRKVWLKVDFFFVEKIAKN